MIWMQGNHKIHRMILKDFKDNAKYKNAFLVNGDIMSVAWDQQFSLFYRI